MRSFILFTRTLLVSLFLLTPLEAKIVHSQQDLKFFELTSFDKPSKYLGFTSSKLDNVVEVPASDTWFVRPDKSMTAKEYARLLTEVKEKQFAGLDISDRWDVTNQTLRHLEGATSLKILRLSDTKVTDQGLGLLVTLPALEVVALNSLTTDAGLKHIGGLKRLRALELHRSKITNTGLGTLKKIPKLRVLDLSDSHITDAGAKTLGTMLTLRQLDISGTQITDRGLSYIKALPKLEVFYATGHLTDKGLSSVAELKKLRSLDLSGSSITNAGLDALSSAKHLEALALSDTAIGDGGMEAVAKLRKLKLLEISGTRVTRDGLDYLKKLPKLEILSVSWTSLSSAELSALYDIKSLKSVILSGRTVDRETFTRIQAIAKRTKKKTKPKTQVAKKLVPARAPVEQPMGKSVFDRSLTPASPKPPAVMQGNALTAPASLETTPESVPRPEIPTSTEPSGEGIMIEVKAASSRLPAGASRMRGLKRIHQIEMAQSPQEMDLQSGGATPTIGDQDPQSTLGEITVNVR